VCCFQLKGIALFIVPTLWPYTIESHALGAQQLSVARSQLAATSLPNHGLAIFAGGSRTSHYVYLICFNFRCFLV
jgi:hypothetical protein